MNRLALSVLLLAVTSVEAAPAPFPKNDRKSDLEKLQGEWDVIKEGWWWQGGKTWANGVDWPVGVRRVTVTGDRVRCYLEGTEQIESGDGYYATLSGSITLARTNSPKRLSIISSFSKEIRTGVYKLDGDT